MTLFSVLLITCSTEHGTTESKTQVTLSRDSALLTPGRSLILTANVLSTINMKQTVIWSSSNPNVATVSNGLVTAFNEGTTIITASTETGNEKADCMVTVVKDMPMIITMQVQDIKDVELVLMGVGTMKVDWGDGLVQERQLTPEGGDYSHTYSNTASHTITLTSEGITRLECTNINVSNLHISQNFTLLMLNCHGNRLRSLDLSRCHALTMLWCGNNELTSLNVTGCSALTYIACGNNQLTSLNLSSCVALEGFECMNNLITDLNIDGCKALTGFYCSNNRLRSLDVGKFTAMTGIDCSNNLLTSLIIRGANSLHELDCRNNQLTSLDASKTDLASISCSSNLLQARALNALFNTLREKRGSIYMANNPGTDGCNQNIATNKGWSFR